MQKKLIIRIKKHWILLLLLSVGILVRAWQIGAIPPGLNQDEISTAYDSYALLHFGIDRNGIPMPAVLISWGSSMQALPAYLFLPAIWTFGLNAFSIRLTSLLFALVSLWLFYALVKRVSGERMALLALFLLVISPWHILLSRWSHECVFFPALFLLGVFLLDRGWQDRRFFWACGVMGLTLYTYAPAYQFVPVFMVMWGIWTLIHNKAHLQRLVPRLIGGSAIFGLVTLPLSAFLIINIFKLQAFITPLISIPLMPSAGRFQTMSVFFSDHPFMALRDNAVTLVQTLITQNDGLLWNTLPGYGALYLFSLPFAVLGIALYLYRLKLAHGKEKDRPVIFFLWLLSALFLGLSMQVNLNRIGIIFLPLIFFTAYGIDFLWKKKLLVMVIISAYIISFGYFTHTYFSTYPSQIGPLFYESLTETIQIASEKTDGRVCVTGHANMPYIYVLFAEQINPHVFIDTVRYENPGAEFQSVRSFGRYVFGLENCTNKGDFGAYVIHESEREQFPTDRYTRTDLKNYSVVVL